MTRAVSLRGLRQLEVGSVELPAPGPTEVIVRVEGCGVCATNLHDWAHPERAMRGSELPGAHGHEVSGVVAEVGGAVEWLVAGDRVCLEPALACACGDCPACAAGRPRSCRNRATLPVWGFADAMVVPERGLVRVPASLDLELACLAEPLASAVHGLRHCWSAADDGRVEGLRVAVVGGGAIGLCATLAARALGAAEVTVVARHEQQARVAEALGADNVLADDDATVPSLRRLRPELVVEAAGGDGSALRTALAAVADDGEVVVLGLPDTPAELDVARLVLHNIHAFFAAAYGTRDGVSDFSVALALLAETAAAAQLITQRYPLADAADAFARAAGRQRDALRVVLRP
jgi:2-desacetyl-2-hydroxyethyl bacteriochlorophyllide A dehydrogenase